MVMMVRWWVQQPKLKNKLTFNVLILTNTRKQFAIWFWLCTFIMTNNITNYIPPKSTQTLCYNLHSSTKTVIRIIKWILTITIEGDITRFEYDGVDLGPPLFLLSSTFNSAGVGGLPNYVSYKLQFPSS